MKLLSAFMFCAILPISVLAANSKVVKSAPDRTCIEVSGKLTCTPKRTMHRAQNMGNQQPLKADGGNKTENLDIDAAKPAKN